MNENAMELSEHCHGGSEIEKIFEGLEDTVPYLIVAGFKLLASEWVTQHGKEG